MLPLLRPHRTPASSHPYRAAPCQPLGTPQPAQRSPAQWWLRPTRWKKKLCAYLPAPWCSVNAKATGRCCCGGMPRRWCCGAAPPSPASEMAGGSSALLPDQVAATRLWGVAATPRGGRRSQVESEPAEGARAAERAKDAGGVPGGLWRRSSGGHRCRCPRCCAGRRTPREAVSGPGHVRVKLRGTGEDFSSA